MTFNQFKVEFAAYCENPEKSTGKGASYAKAMIYMAQYFNLTQMDKAAANKILQHEDELKSPASALYRDVLRKFTEDGHSSYLKSGYVRAAMAPLNSFKNQL